MEKALVLHFPMRLSQGTLNQRIIILIYYSPLSYIAKSAFWLRETNTHKANLNSTPRCIIDDWMWGSLPKAGDILPQQRKGKPEDKPGERNCINYSVLVHHHSKVMKSPNATPCCHLNCQFILCFMYYINECIRKAFPSHKNILNTWVLLKLSIRYTVYLTTIRY